MKHKIYLHTSNFENTTFLKHDDEFETLLQYDAFEYSEAHRNEYGRIKTNSCNYHILIGKLPTPNCPWCNAVPKIKRKETRQIFDCRQFEFYMECTNCGATGPKSILHLADPENEIINNEIESLIKHKYSERFPWETQIGLNE